jgi:hypothetical protein
LFTQQGGLGLVIAGLPEQAQLPGSSQAGSRCRVVG